jgi:tight adherence protein C
MDVFFYIALTLTVFLVLALLAAPVLLRPSPAARRMMDLVQSNRPDERTVGNQERMREAILSLARSLRVRFGLAEDEKVKQQLLAAGVRSRRGMNAYFASRILGPLSGLIWGSFIRSNTLFWALSLAAVFYLVPDMWLKIKIKRRRERIRRGLPDALDLLVICVEAGLGLDQAMLCCELDRS